ARRFWWSGGPSLPPAEPDRRAELLQQELELRLRPRRALDIAEALRLLDRVAQLLDPLAVCRPGLGVEHLEPGGSLGRSLQLACQLGHVELAVGMAEQHVQV